MRGTTNALPAGGGLKVIANGEVQISGRDAESVTLSMPAISVLTDLGTLFPSTETSMGNQSATLDSAGRTITFTNEASAEFTHYYLALG